MASFYVEVVGHYLILVLVLFAGMRLSDCHVACGADIHGGIFVVVEALLAFLLPGVRDDGMELCDEAECFFGIVFRFCEF